MRVKWSWGLLVGVMVLPGCRTTVASNVSNGQNGQSGANGQNGQSVANGKTSIYVNGRELDDITGPVVIVNGKVLSAGSAVRGNGHVITEQRNVAHFDQISSEDAFSVHITAGKTQRIEVEADENLMPLIRTEGEGDRLHLYTSQGTNPTRTINVNISVPSLSALSASGSSDIELQGLNGEQFTVALAGSGNLRLSGTVDSLRASLSGSGNIDAYHLNAAATQVEISGSGSAHISAREALVASVSGSGDIRCSGHPAKVTQSVSGSGTITAE